MAEKSAIKLIKGNDALFEYKLQSYKAKTYVERNGLIYKALIDTSATFVATEWELVNDLREVRVPNISSRNALTGSTPTSGTTGIKIPILDNTNVLVLDAFPDIATHTFARYNWNLTTHTWLLLQAGTGATSGVTSTDYTTLLNKPLIISGITAGAGAGLTGGGTFNGAIPPNRASFTYSHADTSSLANTSNTGFSYIQNVKVDTFGHLTGVTNSTWVHPDTSGQASISNTGRTYIQSIGIDGDGHLTSMSSGVWTHPDTSSQGSASNSGNNFIQSIFLDSDGHVTGLTTTAVSVAGGGVNFNVGGNSGGAIAMPDTGTLFITGGTNVQTVSSLHGTNIGIKVNFVPSGSDSQLQLNTSGFLGTAATLFYTGTTLNAGSLRLSTQPASGSTAHDILVRNLTSGRIERFSFNNLPAFLAALPINAIQYRTANGFGGDAKWIYDPVNKALTLGTRTGTVGSGSTVSGFANIASGILSVAQGLSTTASGAQAHAEGASTLASNANTHAEGLSTTASAAQAHAEGNATTASGTNSHVEGQQNTASGQNSHAGGNITQATNTNTFASGKGFGGGKDIFASGVGAFNHSTNDVNQTAGHGAIANQSAIIGGLNHNIAAGATNAAIIGGSSIKLTGSTYSGMTAVAGLAIFATPNVGGSDDLLTWNATSKKINKITQASLLSVPAGANGYIQFKNNSGLFSAIASLTYLTGTSTLVTSNLNIGSLPTSGSTANTLLTRNAGTGNVERLSISNLPAAPINSIQYNSGSGFGGNASWVFDPTSIALTLGSRGLGFIGANSTAFGANVSATGSSSHAEGQQSKAYGDQSHAEGLNTLASGAFSHAEGGQTTAKGSGAHAEGGQTNAVGSYSHAEGYFTIASGISSHAGGYTGIGKSIIAVGLTAFNHSLNTSSQTNGFGALADQSAILGGQDHNIAIGAINSAIFGGSLNRITGATNSVILGGTALRLTGTSQNNTALVPNLMIWNTPSAGGSDDVLTWNSITKKINKVTQASLGGSGSPAGANTNIQFKNASGGFGAVAALSYLTGTSFFVAPNYKITTVPTIGSLSNNILVRNTVTGNIETVPTTTIFASAPVGNGLNLQGNVIRLGGTLTGNTTISGSAFDLYFTNRTVIIGSSSGTLTGANSLLVGSNNNNVSSSNIIAGSGNVSSGSSTIIIGNGNKTIPTPSVATITASLIGGSGSVISGGSVGNNITGAIAFGYQSVVTAFASHAYGVWGKASGSQSFAFGTNQQISPVHPFTLAAGTGSFNFSFNSSLQRDGFGALAAGSTILNGQDQNIDAASSNSSIINGQSNKISGSTFASIVGGQNNLIKSATLSAIIGGSGNKITGATNSIILGGSNIQLTGATQSNYVAVPNLMIWNTPAAASSTDTILSYNSTTKKVTTTSPVITQNVAYVSKVGNNSTGQIGNPNKPFLTITAAHTAVVASSPSITSSNRGLVIVTQGFYNENVTLKNFVDINLVDAEFNAATEGGVTANTRIFGGGKIKSLTITTGSIIEINIDEIATNAFGTAISVVTTELPDIKIRVHKIMGNIQCANGTINITTNQFIDGTVTSPPFTTSVLLKLYLNANHIFTAQSQSLISLGGSSETNANYYIKANRIESLGASVSAIVVTTNYVGSLFVSADEIIGSATQPTINLVVSPPGNITIFGKIINKNAGNVAAASIAPISGGIIKILNGSQFIPSGSASSIIGSGNVVAVGNIYGKNALSGAPTIQVGTFTANATYII